MIYALILSSMRASKYEHSDTLVAWSESREALERFVEAEIVEPYDDTSDWDFSTRTWRKVFRKGGPLEWFNNDRGSGPDPTIVEFETPEEYATRVSQSAYFERRRLLSATQQVT